MFNGHSWVLGRQEGDKRVLDIMPHEFEERPHDGGPLYYGTLFDLETTGLDTENDEMISIGYIKFQFDDNFNIIRVVEAEQFFNEPENPIPPEITNMTGITNEMVKGHKVTEAHFEKIFGESEFAIAHNTKFDRKFVDRYYKSEIMYGCTNADLSLRADHYLPSGSLSVVMAYLFDQYFGHHDALEDCWATLHILARKDHDYLKRIADKIFSTKCKVYATGSPFSMKDDLRARGYHWDSDVKVWYYPEADEAKRDEEEDWLKENNVNAEIIGINRYDRFK